MPGWTELTNQLEGLPKEQQSQWLLASFNNALNLVSEFSDGRNVLFYGSAFLQKPTVPQILLQITHEDVNGFMSLLHGMDCSKGLTLIMHTPGGVTNATETIVSYLRSKFSFIEVIIPTFAMSAGTMISLAANQIVMGRQSQLGPIDPQMPAGGRIVSALAILDQFERAKKEISQNRQQAHLWAPILPSLGPALLQEAQNAIDYSEQIVTDWLSKYMFAHEDQPKKIAAKASKYFSQGSGNSHRKKSHGRRIDSSEAKSQGLVIKDLESNQNLQEAVLTAYHLLTIIFEKSPAIKIITSQQNKRWIKNVNTLSQR